MHVKPTQQDVLTEREMRTVEDERQRVLAVVRGRCPKCAGELVPVLYRGVERDTCSRCQGVWLDFGELDQMLAEGTGFLGSIRRIFT